MSEQMVSFDPIPEFNKEDYGFINFNGLNLIGLQSNYFRNYNVEQIAKDTHPIEFAVFKDFNNITDTSDISRGTLSDLSAAKIETDEDGNKYFYIPSIVPNTYNSYLETLNGNIDSICLNGYTGEDAEIYLDEKVAKQKRVQSIAGIDPFKYILIAGVGRQQQSTKGLCGFKQFLAKNNNTPIFYGTVNFIDNVKIYRLDQYDECRKDIENYIGRELTIDDLESGDYGPIQFWKE